MRPRAGTYSNIEGEKENVAWYWKMAGIVSSFMILGGFLMLQCTFDLDPKLRIPQTALAIFALALLAVGISFTGLFCFVIRDASFQADILFFPAWSSSILALLTIFYNFLTSSRYTFNLPAILYTIAAALGTIIYGGMLLYTQRKLSSRTNAASTHKPHDSSMPLRPASLASMRTASSTWQEPAYYENYVRNMYPASQTQGQQHLNFLPPGHQNREQTGNSGYDPESISEEEMQRQQMLMLLLHRQQPPTPDPGASTFHIDWQDGQEQEQEEAGSGPTEGYYAPVSLRPGDEVFAGGSGGLRAWGAKRLPGWDGIWRGVGRSEGSGSGAEGRSRRAASPLRREERRREIEMGG